MSYTVREGCGSPGGRSGLSKKNRKSGFFAKSRGNRDTQGYIGITSKIACFTIFGDFRLFIKMNLVLSQIVGILPCTPHFKEEIKAYLFRSKKYGGLQPVVALEA